MATTENDSALLVFSEILGVKRSCTTELGEGEYFSIFSHMRTILPKIATHWHLIMKNKKVVGCSIYTKVSVPTPKVGNATMKFNVDFRLPPKVSPEKAVQVYENLFKNVLKKESTSDESASESDVSNGLQAIGF